MKVNIDAKLEGINTETILKPENNLPLTLKDVCITSLLQPMNEDDEKKKLEKWEIYKKIKDSKDVAELSIEELGIIKKSIGKLQPPLILGQCFELLEGKK